ncbi:MAG: MTAP family purine nucleoside phosphorylase [Chloroflexota bacterium]
MNNEQCVVIFGGTAAYSLDLTRVAQVVEERIIETPFGPSPPFKKLVTERETAVWFASRHGEGTLERSARFVNHRANVWAAGELGARLILSWNGVGAIRPALRVGEIVVPQAIMDWTRHRIGSFTADEPAPPVVADELQRRGAEVAEKGQEKSLRFPRLGGGNWRLSLEPADLAHAQSLRSAARTIDHILHGRDPRQTARPFDEVARRAIQVAGGKWQVASGKWQVANGIQNPKSKIQNPITYVCTEGPRLETAAEIELAADLGADVVGMTLCPEVWLAAELGLGYASLCLVTNFATGRWHIDPRRDFGPAVAERGLTILLQAAEAWQGERVRG